MPKNNARSNVRHRKQIKMRETNRALRSTLQARLKTVVKPAGSAGVAPAK
jgi:hypothetical protein